MIEVDWTTPIEVTEHARVRAWELLGWKDDDAIRGEARSALLEGRIAERVPNWTRGNGYDGRWQDGVRFLWDGDAVRCWVFTTQLGSIYVVTLLLDHGVERDAAERRLIRQGMTRRR